MDSKAPPSPIYNRLIGLQILVYGLQKACMSDGSQVCGWHVFTSRTRCSCSLYTVIGLRLIPWTETNIYEQRVIQSRNKKIMSFHKHQTPLEIVQSKRKWDTRGFLGQLISARHTADRQSILSIAKIRVRWRHTVEHRHQRWSSTCAQVLQHLRLRHWMFRSRLCWTWGAIRFCVTYVPE